MLRSLGDKTLDAFFVIFSQDFDFLTLVETWLPPNSKVNFEGFYSFSTFRKNKDRQKGFLGELPSLLKRMEKRSKNNR